MGLTPEAVKEILRHGFENLDCAAIWCAHYDFNDQSRRVIEKTGFRLQKTKDTTNLLDVTHPTLFYALTKEEWQKQ
jgi:RimJ/RimL family protein N-acetyltransferase